MKNLNKVLITGLFSSIIAGSLNALPLKYSQDKEMKSNKIVGGIESDIKKHPYVVSLQRANGGHYCGGSLVAPNFVLSAGHCVDFIAPKDMKIVIGSQNNSASASTAEVHKVVKVTTHPEFVNTWSEISHDYAVIELATSSKFAPIDMIDMEEDAFVLGGGNSTTMGWGTTSEGGSLARTLMEVTVPLVTTEKCLTAYPGEINDSMICAGLDEGGKDSCQGDSGGPLVVSTLNDANQTVEILVGVVSWGAGCARPKKYGVYSDVAFGREWIDSVMALNPEFLMANR